MGTDIEVRPAGKQYAEPGAGEGACRFGFGVWLLDLRYCLLSLLLDYRTPLLLLVVLLVVFLVLLLYK